MTLWKVGDREMSTLMKSFYAGYLERAETPAEALRQAQLAVLADQREASEVDPWAWAGVVVTRPPGSGRSWEVRRTLDDCSSRMAESLTLARETNEQIERLSTQQARLAEVRLKAVQSACQAIVNPSKGLIILVGLVALALGLVSVGDVSGLVETWMGWAQVTVAPGE